MGAGNAVWQEFQRVLMKGREVRGGAHLNGTPTLGTGSQLPDEWSADVAHASHVVYHYGTPVAWIDGVDHGWVVPEVTYSATTTGCQNKIREALGGREKFRAVPVLS